MWLILPQAVSIRYSHACNSKPLQRISALFFASCFVATLLSSQASKDCHQDCGESFEAIRQHEMHSYSFSDCRFVLRRRNRARAAARRGKGRVGCGTAFWGAPDTIGSLKAFSS
jgi:hypothetical protein